MSGSPHHLTRVAITVVAVLVATVLVGPGAGAATTTVTVSSSGYSPASLKVALGTTVTWNFTGPSGQTVTENPFLNLGLSSGPEPTGGSYSFTFNYSGSFSYKDQLTGATGSVKVPITVSPSSGTTGTSFNFVWGRSAPPSGDVFDPQVAFCPAGTTCPSLDFGSLYPGTFTTQQSASFVPPFGPGTYSLRSRLVDTQNGKSSKVPAAVAITVTAGSAGMGNLSPDRGLPGTQVTISGWDFTGATDVQFNGMSVGSGNFTVVSDSTITAAVPTGATTGAVSVVTPHGTAVSPYAFTVAPAISHIVVIMMENESYSQVIGASDAPYLTSLASSGENDTQAYGAQHGSLADYIAITSGDTPSCGVTSEKTGGKTPSQCPDASTNIVDQLQSAGLTWKAYVENYPGASGTCDTTDAQVGQYDVWHVPFLYYTDITSNPTRCQNIVDFSELSTDLAASALPTYAFIAPNTYDDMARSCQTAPCPPGAPDKVAQGDDWLSTWVPQLLNAGAEVVITWDEGEVKPVNDPTGCCYYASGGHIPTLVVGGTAPTASFSTAVDTYSVLGAIESAYGLPLLRRAGCFCSIPVPL